MEVINKTIPIKAIRAHERNYRIHPDSQISQLGASHSRFGQFRSVVLHESINGEYITVAGHGIIEAMRRNGVTAVRADVLPSSTSQEEIDAILVADNLHAQNAEDDQDMLAQILQEQQDLGYDLASLGSDDESLRQLLESLGNHYLDNDGSEEEEDEDLLDISKESQAVEAISKLRFGKYEVPLTQDEFKDLERKLKRYSDDMGSYHGFVRTLL
jgi:ParB-like chromosome segregation protein Spo0J